MGYPNTVYLFDALAASAALLLASQYFLTLRRKLPLPPGPVALPLIGSALSWPSLENREEVFNAWGRRYGPLTYTSVYGQPYLIINSADAAFDLLDQRGADYADRPIRPLLDLCGASSSVANSQYGPRLQRMRRMIISWVGKGSRTRHGHMLETERHRFLRRVLEDPGNLAQHTLTSSSASILDVVFGLDVHDMKDPTIVMLTLPLRILRPVYAAMVVIPYFILHHLPLWIPSAKMYHDAIELKTYVENVNMKLYQTVKNDLAQGIARKSFVAVHLDELELAPEKNDLIKWSGYSMFTAGFATTTETINTFIYAMMAYPEVQTRAQAEIDAIIGHERLPGIADIEKLPFTNALLKEVIRWCSPVTAGQGVPHRLRRDDYYHGYLIPKDTTVIVNIRAILHDSSLYNSPDSFKPERFLGLAPERDPSDFVFGFGRRVCPGSDFALTSLFLHATGILSVYDVLPLKNGSKVDPINWLDVPVFPALLNCVLKPRSEGVRTLISAVEFRGEHTKINTSLQLS